MSDFKHILVPTDFSDPAQNALDLAVELAAKYNAALTLVHAYEIPSYDYAGVPYMPIDLLTPIEEAANQALEDALTALHKRMPAAKAILRRGVPWREILDVAAEVKADLIVLGTHGRRGVKHLLLGSVAEKIVRMSPVPVLTTRGQT